MMRSAHDGQILLWPALIGRLRFLMDVDEAQFAGHLGVDEPTVEGWERGLLVPERRTQKILRDRLHRLEPAISLKAIEAMPVISAVHSNTTLALCCVASQPYADQYGIQAQELRYLMIGHLWNDSIAQAADAIASHEAWKGGECAYVRMTIQQPDGQWAHYAASPIGTTDMALWIGGLCEPLLRGRFEPREQRPGRAAASSKPSRFVLLIVQPRVLSVTSNCCKIGRARSISVLVVTAHPPYRDLL